MWKQPSLIEKWLMLMVLTNTQGIKMGSTENAPIVLRHHTQESHQLNKTRCPNALDWKKPHTKKPCLVVRFLNKTFGLSAHSLTLHLLSFKLSQAGHENYNQQNSQLELNSTSPALIRRRSKYVKIETLRISAHEIGLIAQAEIVTIHI